MEVGIVRQVDINEEMRASYLDYAMSVIVSRALPDARDGLKPVHRRILFAMYDMGLLPRTPYRKSARIVGEVLGKYHPHGDDAVYDAMVRMAQDFSMRYPLVDGQGNFGSVDGDAAAAMRYTEARMQLVGNDMLLDINKQTVDFEENFDGSLNEPSVLPATLPNLLVNGSSGIAVGMSTSVPPHNLGEVCDALTYMLDRWDNLEDIGIPDLMQFIKGPDFPTGGLVFTQRNTDETDQIRQAYATGRGKLRVQARAHVERLSRGRNRIIITELPYQTNKTNLIERIASLVRDERIEGLSDLRDESDRQGMRIVIELSRNADPDEILADLYKMTPMRSTFSVIMLALVDGEPRTLSLKQALRVFLDHRQEIVRRRSTYDLERARERAHILEGYIVALDNLDEIIDTIRRSRTVETARNNLMRNFSLTQVQAQAILDMPLRRLAALERKKIEEEYAEKKETIEYLEALLADETKMRVVIKDELAELKENYGDPRRTLIVDSSPKNTTRMLDFLPDEEVWVVITEGGLMSRTLDDQMPKVTQSINDPPRFMLKASPSDLLYLFDHQGDAATLPVHQLEKASDYQKGFHYSSVSSLSEHSRVEAALVQPYAMQTGYLTVASRSGNIKRIELDELPGLSANSFPVIGLSDDELLDAFWTQGGQEIVLVSANGKAIRFSEDEVRPMGLRAGGVKGMKLSDDNDQLVGMLKFDPDKHLWVITADGNAKSSPMADYPLQGRYGQGVITYKFKKNEYQLAAAAAGHLEDNIVVMTTRTKPKYMRISLAPNVGRNVKGISVVALGPNEYVSRVVVPSDKPMTLSHDASETESESDAEDTADAGE